MGKPSRDKKRDNSWSHPERPIRPVMAIESLPPDGKDRFYIRAFYIGKGWKIVSMGDSDSFDNLDDAETLARFIAGQTNVRRCSVWKISPIFHFQRIDKHR